MVNRIIQKLIQIPLVKNVIEKEYTKIPFKLAYNEDGLMTKNIPHFIDTDEFSRAYKAGVDAGAWVKKSMRWRAYVACWAANYAKSLDGDFIELGVDKGGLASSICQYVNFNQLNKQFYLIDSFEGIPIDYVSDKEKSINNPEKWNKKYGDTYNTVKENFNSFNNVHIIKGIIPDVLGEIKTDKICFMSIDLNNAYPEIEGIKHFWDRVEKYGIIVLDDYAHGEKFSVQREEWDKFANSKGLEILNIPTGQGILIKQ